MTINLQESPEVEIKVLDKGLLNEWHRDTSDYFFCWTKSSYFPPKPQTPGAAGYDLRACINEPLELRPGQTEMVSCGVSLHIDDPNLCGVLAPRSGLANKFGVVLGNSFGVVDSDYQGELFVYLHLQMRMNDNDPNRTQDNAVIKPYERIAQLLFVPVVHPKFEVVEEFSFDTERGARGFGSTGKA